MDTLVASIQTDHEHREFDWLAREVVAPEFAQIIETLQLCLDLLLYNSPEHPDEAQHIERGPPIKLPVLLSKLETLKGVVTRDGAYVTDLHLSVREPQFNRVLNKLTLLQPLLLEQIITAKRSIDAAIALIHTCQTHECDEGTTASHTALVEAFHEMLSHLLVAKTSLQLPTDPGLIFPRHVTNAAAFEPELTPQIAVDLYINQAEVCLDLKKLHLVTELPWGDIDPELGTLYIDIVKNEIQQGKPLDRDYIEKRLRELARSHHELGFFSNVLNMMKPKYDPIDYVTKCVTYNGGVVMIMKMIEVALPDPVLVLAFTKLDSVEYLITRFLDSLNSIMK